ARQAGRTDHRGRPADLERRQAGAGAGSGDAGGVGGAAQLPPPGPGLPPRPRQRPAADRRPRRDQPGRGARTAPAASPARPQLRHPPRRAELVGRGQLRRGVRGGRTAAGSRVGGRGGLGEHPRPPGLAAVVPEQHRRIGGRVVTAWTPRLRLSPTSVATWAGALSVLGAATSLAGVFSDWRWLLPTVVAVGV